MNDKRLNEIEQKLDEIDEQIEIIEKGNMKSSEITKAIEEMLEYTTEIEKSMENNTNKITKILKESDLNRQDYFRATESMVTITNALKKHKQKLKNHAEDVQILQKQYDTLQTQFTEYQYDTNTRIVTLQSQYDSIILKMS